VTQGSPQESILPAEVAEAVDSVRQELGSDADINAIIAALRARNLGFIQAILGLRAIKGTPLPDAKRLVHHSPAYAETAEDREEFWTAVQAIMREVDEGPDDHVER